MSYNVNEKQAKPNQMSSWWSHWSVLGIHSQDKTLWLQTLSPLEREADSRQTSFTFPDETSQARCEKCPKAHAVAGNIHYFRKYFSAVCKRIMFIKKTWHFLGNFALHSHVYWAKLISTMQIIVKSYARLYKYSWDRNYIQAVGRNRTNLDLESKEIRSTWLSNGENDQSPSPSLSEQTDECDKGRGGCSALPGRHLPRLW